MTRRWIPPTPRTSVCACWSAGMLLATASYLAVIYPTLPRGLPVRYVRGEPLIYQLKTPALVMLPALVQAALLVTFAALGLMLLWRARPDRRDPAAAADTARMRLAVEGVALLGALWITVQSVGAARLVALWQGGTGGFGAVYNVTVLAGLVASVAIVMRTMRTVRGERHQPAAATDPAMWRLSSLYVNRADPALFVPTRRGVGWTLNFGRPVAIAILAGILVAGAGAPYLLARLILRLGD